MSRNRSHPDSPKKRDLTRKGSKEKITRGRGGAAGQNSGVGGSGGSRSKRNLRRSQTAPGGRAAGADAAVGGVGRRSRGEQMKIDAYKQRNRGNRSPPSSAAKRIRDKHHKGGSGGGSSSSKYRKGGGGGSGQDSNHQATVEMEVRDKSRAPTGLDKCLRKFCGIGSIGNTNLESDQARTAVRKLRLTPSDIITLRSSFNEIDIDESGEIDYDEFMESMEEHRNAFTDAVFRLIDINGDGLLEFDEFVAICGSFCMWSQQEILQFCFNTFDADGGGTIDEEEFEALAKTISHKDPTFPGNFARALEEFDTDGDGLIDFDEFVTMNRRYPMVLFPMFRLQDKMQKQTLGLKRWNQIMKKQNKLVKVRQWRFTHGGEMPPEGCWSKLTRCGAPRLGMDEDFADLEREMNLIKRSDGKKKTGGSGSTGQVRPGSKMAW